MGNCDCSAAPCRDKADDDNLDEASTLYFHPSLSEPLVDPEDLRLPRRVKRFSSFAPMNGTPLYTTEFPPLVQRPGCLSIVLLLLTVIILSYATVCSRSAVPIQQCTYFMISEVWLDQHGLSFGQLLKYLSIPLVSIVFTYVHIWAALYMTFYPMRFIGCLQIPDTNVGCGWQGIIPNKAAKMAQTAVRLMTEKLIDVQEIIDRIDADEIIKELEPVLDKTLFQTIEEVSMQEEPHLWKNIPDSMKDALVVRARAQAPDLINAFLTDMKTNIKDVFDLEELVVGVFTREPQLLNHMFITCGYTELKFIRNCGAYMGGAFGVVQVIVWMFYSAGWMLPTFGFIAGVLSNWIALKMIFEPVEPKNICGFKIQGLFLQRQQAVSEVYAQIVTDNVLYSRNIVRGILRGRLSDKLFALLHQAISKSTDKLIGESGKALVSLRRIDLLAKSKRKAAEIVLEQMPDTAKHVNSYLDTALDLERLLQEKLAKLPSADFEQLLHPVFQEDEWKLVLMGGVLGVVIGFIQWHFLGS
mmetsp:Transcript_102682/g.162306  ORF Transcript_102682/g.162306 Transcript_102682/m.162306 type:complete len:527 (-) Transcript_102682:98-1678(-)